MAVGEDYPDVPEYIAHAANEAHVCNSVGAYRAAVLLARSVIEATAKDKGITSGGLVSKIDALYDAGVISPVIKEGAHVAHGDFGLPVEEIDATEVLTLMAQVLHDAYQQEAKILRLRAARDARKAGASQ